MRIFLVFLILLICNLSFGLNIDEAVRIALEKNGYLSSVKAYSDSKKYDYLSGKALRYPSIFLDASYTVMDDKKTQPFVTPFGAQEITMSEKEFWDIFAGVKWNVYTGGLVSSLIESKKLEYGFSKFNLQEEKLNVMFKVKSAYIDLLKLIANRIIVEDYIKSLEAHLRDVKLMYDEGLVAYIDVLQTEVKVNEAKQKLTAVNNQIKVAKTYLNILMGNDALEINDTIEDISYKYVKIPSINILYDTAKKNRPAFKLLENKVKLADVGIKSADSEWKPKLYVVGGYKYSDMLDDIEPKGNFLIKVGVNFQLDWDKPLKERSSKKLLKYSAIKKKDDGEKKLLLEVKQAYENYKTAEKNLKVAKISVEKANEYYRILNLKYKEGLASNSDLLDAAAMLTEAKMKEKDAYYNILKSLFAIEKAVGKTIAGVK